MNDFIGLSPAPKDEDLLEFLKTLVQKDRRSLEETITELLKTIVETRETDQPISFAYAKLLNYLSQGIQYRELVHLCAAALWRLRKLEGE